MEGELVVVLGVARELLVHGGDHAQVVQVVALGCRRGDTEEKQKVGEEKLRMGKL